MESSILAICTMYVLICSGVRMIWKDVCLTTKNLGTVLRSRGGVVQNRYFMNRAVEKVLTIPGWDLQ